jgi:CHAT domain-containing protein
MDKQRMQAYLGLIEQLLNCAQGKEGDLLQTNVDLVDAGLVAMMQLYSQHVLRLQGQEQHAQWLLELAGQLAKTMGLTADGELRGNEPTLINRSQAFLSETLQLIESNHEQVDQVYSFWRANLTQFTPDLLEALPLLFSQRCQDKPEQTELVAALFVAFSCLVAQFPLGIRWLNLELAISTANLTLQVYTRSIYPEQWAVIQSDLAYDYLHRIQGERADNIEQAITACQLALQVYTRGSYPEEWAAIQNNLAIAYSTRIRDDQSSNQEQSIAACQLALQIYTREAYPEQWAAIQNNLVNIYYNRVRGERADNLEQAIIVSQMALQIATYEASPGEWARIQNNLANAYRDRIRGERADNLEQAITASQSALQVYARETYPEQWAAVQNNLADAYRQRIRGDHADNLELSIAAYQLALQVYTREVYPEQWARMQNNLALSYSERILGDRADNLERSIAGYQLALQITTQENFPTLWARAQNNLGITYYNRIHGDRADNLEQSIAAYQLALLVRTQEAYPEQWAMTNNNLAMAYAERIRGKQVENFEQATFAYQLALQVYTQNAFPKKCRNTARNLGNFHFKQRTWLDATNAYTTALNAAETLYQSCILLDGKAAELTENAALHRFMAYALARLDNLKAAVETLEQGRARGLSEGLDRNRANLIQLQQTAPDLYTQYQDSARQLYNLEAQERDLMVSSERYSLTPEVLRNNATKIRQQITTILDQIRLEPGYENFLRRPIFEDVQKAVTEHIIIYLLTTPAGSLALIVTSGGIDCLWLDDFTDTHLNNLIQTWFIAYKNAHGDRQTWLDTIDQITQQLWNSLMGPLVQQLQEKGIDNITLIPTGLLSLLPLHAAWTPDDTQPIGRRYALDDLHITYVPNAKSLTAAQAIADRVQPNSILAIDNPHKDLPNSKREIDCAIDSFSDRTTLREEQATIAAVKDGLVGAAIAHFSCHGNANLNEPLTTGLVMSDGILTLKDIFALNLADSGGLRLAILSACETGIQGIENADEAISLPTGLLQAGVAAVIASLWSVDDLSTMLLLSRFYDLWRKDSKEPAVALLQAQQWVRDTTSQQKAQYLKESNSDLFQSFVLLPPNYFAHPFHWAAFIYVGV